MRVAAVVLWIAFGALLGWLVRGQVGAVAESTAETELIERARVAHVIYTAEPRRAVEVAASQEEDMIRWLSKRMNAAVRVPKLKNSASRRSADACFPAARDRHARSCTRTQQASD